MGFVEVYYDYIRALESLSDEELVYKSLTENDMFSNVIWEEVKRRMELGHNLTEIYYNTLNGYSRTYKYINI